MDLAAAFGLAVGLHKFDRVFERRVRSQVATRRGRSLLHRVTLRAVPNSCRIEVVGRYVGQKSGCAQNSSSFHAPRDRRDRRERRDLEHERTERHIDVASPS